MEKDKFSAIEQLMNYNQFISAMNNYVKQVEANLEYDLDIYELIQELLDKEIYNLQHRAKTEIKCLMEVNLINSRWLLIDIMVDINQVNDDLYKLVHRYEMGKNWPRYGRFIDTSQWFWEFYNWFIPRVEVYLEIEHKKNSKQIEEIKKDIDCRGKWYKDKKIIDIWEGDDETYDKLLTNLQEPYLAIDKPFITKNGDGFDWNESITNDRQYIAGLIYSLMQGGFIKKVYTSTELQKIILNTFEFKASFNKKPLKSISTSPPLKQYLLPFEKILSLIK